MEQQKVDLDALEAAHKKATPGEWEAHRYSNYSGWSVYAPEVGCIAERWYSTGQQDEIPRNDQFIVMVHNALPALIAELRQLRAWEAHMRRFAKSMAEDGHPILMGFAYQVQAILGTHALPLPAAPEAR